ncbi:MAG: GNAT family N-acetyltransferase [Bryobacteraceae bacterium]
MSEDIRLLRPSDIDDALALSRAAGWNQTRHDWARVMQIEPEGCFGLERDGRVVATTTAVRYGSALAWIGMVLTDPAFRGRGFARALMRRAIEYLRGVDWVKLDATDMGRPLYLELGFVDECAIERWEGSGSQQGGQPAPSPAQFDLDLAAFGADRTRLLTTLETHGAIGIPGEGYAMGRDGANAAFFGPCVARNGAAAARLLAWFLDRRAGERIFWDVLPDNSDAVRLARDRGFQLLRRLTRMARPGRSAFSHDVSRVYAAAGFEYG